MRNVLFVNIECVNLRICELVKECREQLKNAQRSLMVEIKCMQMGQGAIIIIDFCLSLISQTIQLIGKQSICEAKNRWIRLVAKATKFMDPSDMY
jgi:hypothetical protein